MVHSMTGFGRCRETVNGLDITVEIKSVNSRYFDCTAKVSRAYGYLEERVKPYLQSKGVSRGKVDVWIGVERLESGAEEISIDEGYLRGYLDALYRLRDEYGLRDDINQISNFDKNYQPNTEMDMSFSLDEYVLLKFGSIKAYYIVSRVRGILPRVRTEV